MKKIVVPRVPSTQASDRTIRDRTVNINEHIKTISGDEEGAALRQLGALLKNKSKVDLKKLLHSEELLQIRIPAGEELKFKAEMGWTWCQLRKLKK